RPGGRVGGAGAVLPVGGRPRPPRPGRGAAAVGRGVPGGRVPPGRAAGPAPAVAGRGRGAGTGGDRLSEADSRARGAAGLDLPDVHLVPLTPPVVRPRLRLVGVVVGAPHVEVRVPGVHPHVELIAGPAGPGVAGAV